MAFFDNRVKFNNNNNDSTKIQNNNITLYNDDYMNIIKNIANNSIDLIVTDPPYLLSLGGGGGIVNTKLNFKKSLNKGILNNTQLKDGYDIKSAGLEFLRICKIPNIYIWCNKLQIPDYFDFYVKQYNLKFDILSWHKPNVLPTYSNKYLTDTEYCLYFRGTGVCFPKCYEDAKTFWLEPINQKDKKLWNHPTIKPLNMIEKLIRNSSKEGDTVLDPFMGSGTTGVACKKLNRNFIGIEINKEYFDLAQNRIQYS